MITSAGGARALFYAGLSALLTAAASVQSASTLVQATRTFEKAGRTALNRFVTPANQVLTPAGVMAELPGLRPQGIALSPDGRLLAVSGKTSQLLIINPVTGLIAQHVPLPSDKLNEPPPDVVSTHLKNPDKDGQLSFTGLIFSPNGKRIYLANVNGSIKVFGVAGDGKVSGLFSIPLPKVSGLRRTNEIPAGLAFSRDGRLLYVALNLSNRLGEFDAATGKLLRLFDVGVAPYDVVLARGKAYVSNWGGRRPDADSVTGPAGRGALVRVDPVRYIASEGSVSVIDLTNGAVRAEIVTGLHASALALTPNRRRVVVANAGSDCLSVIDTRSDKVVEKIWVKENPTDLFGASPNALAFDKSGDTLFVCNGTQNAVAVVDFSPGKSRLRGLIPVGWYPGAIAYDARRKHIYVANIKGFATRGSKKDKGGETIFNSLRHVGGLSLVPVPSTRELQSHTADVLFNYRAEALREAMRPARPDQPPRPVPERAGEPGVFKHVVYIIKENRTYDQVLGDIARGNGDTNLCIFGERITPNQHKMARDFALLDNTYCSGILSADGHQWSTTAFATDYMEKSFAGFPRSYPDGMGEDEIDALAYSPAGFLWDNALAHGKTFRDYGEFAIGTYKWKDKARKKKPTFAEIYHDFVNGTGLITIGSYPAVESLRPHLVTNTIGWEMVVPDVFRAAQFIKELREFEAKGALPNLIMICLPNDHTSGTDAGLPTPAAHAADNDLAFGQIVEAISHSRFWKETCLFAIEDDPQNGWDHVSGYRTTAYVISPYTRRGEVVSTQFNQTSLLRTMELMLGLPPMNLMDATAAPMSDCFTETPDFTPFVALTNNVPLDQLNPDPKKVTDALLRKHAYASARLPLEKPDQCPEDLLNRILWHAMKGSQAPYPEWAVTLVKDDADD